ncbi:MAG: hypothetical protein QOF79_74 [Actinomycetota bacterium]|nr:hypothetical protein [Actinomycetota bacterium]
MPVDPTLRDLFGDDGHPHGQLDVRAIIRRSKRRRLPRQIGVGSVATLAAVGVFTGAGFGLNLLGSSNTTGSVSSLAGGSAAPDTATDGSAPAPEIDKRTPADQINACGQQLARPAPSATGLTLTVDFPDATVGAASVSGTVTLTNTGTAPIDGVAFSEPAVTLSQDGTVLWHSHDLAAGDPLAVRLAPGESQTFDASFQPVRCNAADDTVGNFPADLPPVPAGDYDVSAAMDVTVDSNAELVTGPLSTVTLK